MKRLAALLVGLIGLMLLLAGLILLVTKAGNEKTALYIQMSVELALGSLLLFASWRLGRRTRTEPRVGPY